MSRELLHAAAQGKIEIVKREMKTANIDYVGTTIETGSHKVTPLTASLIMQHYEIAALLINAGARLERIGNSYTVEDCYLYGYPLICFILSHHMDNKIVHLMLAKVSCLNPINIKEEGHQSFIVEACIHREKMKKKPDFTLLHTPGHHMSGGLFHNPLEKQLHCSILLTDILLEALFRSDELIYTTILANEYQQKISKENLIEYLKDRQVNSNDLQITGNALIDARNYQLDFTDTDILEVTAFMKKQARIKTTCITDLPIKLWSELPLHTTSDLNTLTSELFYLLFPEEYFTPFHVESTAFQHSWGKKLPENEIDILKSKQHPVNLRKILNFDQLEIIMKLSSKTSHLRENFNPAVNSLAEILLFHGCTMISIDDKEEPLLSAKQCDEFIKILHRYHNTSPSDQMMLRAMNQQTTHEPANEIKALTQSIAELKEQLTNIGDKVDKLTMIVCRQMNLGQQDTVKRNGMF